MTFLPECGADNLYFSRQKLFLLIKWVHNDFMYVRFAGIRNTKTWSKYKLSDELNINRALNFSIQFYSKTQT